MWSLRVDELGELATGWPARDDLGRGLPAVDPGDVQPVAQGGIHVRRTRGIDGRDVSVGPWHAGAGSPCATSDPGAPWAGPAIRGPRRAPRPTLDRPQIVAAALRIIDTEGIEACSLRRLADALGVTAMSLYWHVRNKAELLELVGYAVLAGIEIPPTRGDWRAQLADVHRPMLQALLRHPNTVDVLIGRARYGPGGLALFERILGIPLEASFTPKAAFDAYSSLYRFTLAFMATSSRTPEFREIQRQGVLYLLSLPVERFPAIRQVAPAIGRRSLEAEFAIGLDVQIAGIAARLAPQDAA